MEKIAKFEKVSFDRFYADYCDIHGTSVPSELVWDTYEKIQLPRRATKGSAGYDFFAPYDITLEPGKSIKLPTGIRVRIDDGWVLMLYPRSGLGFKYRLKLNNTVGVIDADYYGSDNEGHILFKIYADEPLTIKAGTGFAQGIFMPFGITEDDEVTEIRNGGFGSTTK